MGIIMTTKQLRPRRPRDFYPTPEALVRAALNLVRGPRFDMRILDPGCGDGVWGRVAKNIWPLSSIFGVDIQPGDLCRAADYDFIYTTDYLGWFSGEFDLIIGNPPYEKAEEFIRHSLAHLAPRGEMIFLLRLAFLASQSRARGLWREHPPSDVYVLGRRPSFTGDGKTDATDYALFRWAGAGATETALHWLDWGLT